MCPVIGGGANRALPLAAWSFPALWLVDLTWETAGCGWLMGYWLPSGFLLSCTQEVWFHVPLEIIFCGGEKYSFSCQRNILLPTMVEKLTTSTKWNLLNVSMLCSSFQLPGKNMFRTHTWSLNPTASSRWTPRLIIWPKTDYGPKMSLLLLHAHTFTHCCVWFENGPSLFVCNQEIASGRVEFPLNCLQWSMKAIAGGGQ